jgi:hypothetical protein
MMFYIEWKLINLKKAPAYGRYIHGNSPMAGIHSKTGVGESRYQCQLCTYPKVGLGLVLKSSTTEDSYLKSATPYFFPDFYHLLLSPT